MSEFTPLFQQSNAWFFIPSAILLGALHGLEPGHSKTMMAAFIIAIKGTARQATMLGLAAALSHTAIVWLIALGGMYISNAFTAESAEPWLQMMSGMLILGMACLMCWRTWRGERDWLEGKHGNQHHHHHELNLIDNEDPHDHEHVALNGQDVTTKEYRDAHALAHANDLQRRFTGKEVTNGQILLFGLTGGLVPCPAAITVLLICLQLKALTLGAALVVCFSIGLALTMVAVGVGAALSVNLVAKRWSGFTTLAKRAPYFSSALIAAVGLYIGISGLTGLVN